MDIAIAFNVSDNALFFTAVTLIVINVAQSFFTRRKR